MLEIKVDIEKLNILEKSLSPIFYIVKKRSAIEYVSRLIWLLRKI